MTHVLTHPGILRSTRGALAAVLAVGLMALWPAVAQANLAVDWNRLMLKLEPLPRFTLHTRAAVLVHVAMHDAINSIPGARRYTTYLPPLPGAPGASPEAALSAAAHWVMREYTLTFNPGNTALLAEIEALYATSLASIPDGPAKTAGIQLGEASAQQIWEARANDGWNNPDGIQWTFPTPAPGVWRQTPPFPSNMAPPFYWWDEVTPWAMTHASQFMSPPPPDIRSKKFLRDVLETYLYGASQSPVRTPDQTHAAQWWALCPESNAGASSLIAGALILSHDVDLYESTRIFALVTMAVADAMISNIENKNTWNFWRPITVIRENFDPDWTPLLTTPPNQEYPAGHPMGSGAGIYVLAKFFPGKLRQPVHVESPGCGTRTYARVTDAVEDVINARIYGGMHFRHSGEVGAHLGKQIAHWIYDHTLRPLGR